MDDGDGGDGRATAVKDLRGASRQVNGLEAYGLDWCGAGRDTQIQQRVPASPSPIILCPARLPIPVPSVAPFPVLVLAVGAVGAADGEGTKESSHTD